MTDQDAQPSRRELGARELGARELAGFRVLRSLARDERAEVLLGHRAARAGAAESAGAETTGAAGAGADVTGAETVALKVLPATALGWQAALHECAALDRARGDHVVELLDVDSDEHSIRLVFERLPRGDLAELLRVRERLEGGEAVTLLAPIAVTLLRLHTAGVAHGKVTARSVLFRDDGSPTLIGFTDAALFEPGAPEVVLEGVGAVQRDRAAARALAATVLGRVAGGRARAARELCDDVAACDDELVLPLLASRLFDVAAAMAVRFAPDDRESDAAGMVARAVPVDAAAGLDSRDTGSPASELGERGQHGPSRVAAVLAGVVPEPLVQRVLDTVGRSPAAPLVRAAAESVSRRWRSWTSVRRRVVLAVAAAALTVVVVTAVVPVGTSAGAVARGHEAKRGSDSATASPATTGAPRSDLARDNSVVMGDDPLPAASALLTARDRCLGTLSLRCLDGVDEPSSGAFRDDQAAIRAAQQGGELPDPLGNSTGVGSPALVQRLGDSALVRLGDAASESSDPSAPQREPASLLLVKGEAGWRIRDVIAAR